MNNSIKNFNYKEIENFAKDVYREKYFLNKNTKVDIEYIISVFKNILLRITSKSKHTDTEYLLINIYKDVIGDLFDPEFCNVNWSFLPKDECEKWLSKYISEFWDKSEKLQFSNIARRNNLDCDKNFKCVNCDKYGECKDSWDDYCDGQEYVAMIDDGMN